MRLEPKPDAGVLGEADFLGGVVKGDDALRVLYGLLFDGAITRSTPVEYRLRPRKRAAICHDSAETKNGVRQLPFFKPVKLFDYLTYFDKIA